MMLLSSLYYLCHYRLKGLKVCIIPIESTVLPGIAEYSASRHAMSGYANEQLFYLQLHHVPD